MFGVFGQEALDPALAGGRGCHFGEESGVVFQAAGKAVFVSVVHGGKGHAGGEFSGSPEVGGVFPIGSRGVYEGGDVFVAFERVDLGTLSGGQRVPVGAHSASTSAL